MRMDEEWHSFIGGYIHINALSGYSNIILRNFAFDHVHKLRKNLVDRNHRSNRYICNNSNEMCNGRNV